MRLKVFDVVKLKDCNSATILGIREKEYFTEIVNKYGTTIDKKIITDDEIENIIYSK